jgi:multidrug resistance efflux pump
MTVDQARALVERIQAEILSAQDEGRTEIDLLESLAGADDYARAALQAAIDKAS